VENKFDQRASQGARLKTKRFKERISFKIAWMQIDVTCVQQQDQHNPQTWRREYECELEITDSNYLSQYLNDQTIMRKFARKFLLNQMCLGTLVTNIIGTIAKPVDPNAGKLMLNEQ
jgi:hypothetical protein